MRILIVDDNEDICRLAVRVLRTYAKCQYVVNGKKAIDEIKLAHEQNDPFDCVFLDIMMPGIDGINVLKKIRQMETDQHRIKKKRIKIIMLTAYNDAKHVLESFKEQADGYIVKPFDEEKLVEEMEKLHLI